MKAAVLGSPVGHSLSPVLHRAAYAELGLREWSYGLFECEESGLGAFLAECDESWAGLSLTMPLKKRAMELADKVDDLATRVGGANTLVRGGGAWCAYNTDVGGIVEALAEAGLDGPRTVAVLGAGATAASALAAFSRFGRGAVDGGGPEVVLLARDTGRAANALAAAERLSLDLTVAGLDEIGRHLDVDLVVSTLPPGAADAHAAALARSRAALFDVVYAPWPTAAADAVAARGGTVVGGFPMLLHQAVAQVCLMTGIEDVPVEAMRAAGGAELLRRSGRRG